MELILTPKRVTVSDCREEEGKILLKIQNGTELQYVGEADIDQVRAETLNKRITLGVDPEGKYCALMMDIMKQQLR